MEQLDYDPTKIEKLEVMRLKVNDKLAITGSAPWIIDDIEDKIQSVLGKEELTSISI